MIYLWFRVTWHRQT